LPLAPAPFAPLLLLLVLVPVAAIVGDQVGYLIGKRAGQALFQRADSRLFKRSYVERSRGFFERYGARTILLARFVPVVRTFAPVVAGASGMPYRSFLAYNVVGGVLWGVGVTTLGYLLGGVGLVRDHIEIILVRIVLIVVVSLVPVLVEVLRARRAKLVA